MRRLFFPYLTGTRLAVTYWLTPLLLCAAACSIKLTPEEEIRALVREAELAVEERQVDDFARLISSRYGDAHGNDKDELLRMLRLQMIRNQVIYLLVRVSDIRVRDELSAAATVRVAMAGGPLETFEDLGRLGAELYRFDIDLVKESGKWRIITASWRHALEADFG